MSSTRTRILEAAEKLLSERGPAGLTFDAVAAQVGVSKQAVLYWFPGKTRLMAAVALSLLRAEADTAIRATETAPDPKAARGAVVEALIAFHMADLPRFRQMYAAPQLGPQPQWARDVLDQVHEITGEMYAAIAQALGGGCRAREQAVALHMAALGHVLLAGLGEAVGDPLRHGPDRLAQTLVGLLARPG